MWPAIKRVLRPLATLVRWIQREHIHQVVASPDGASAFVLFGAPRWRHHFERVCLGDHSPARVRQTWHPTDWSPQARALAAQHGLVVVSDTSVPSGIASALLTVPTFVAMGLDLLESEEAFLAAVSSRVLRDLQRVRAGKFRVEVSRDPAWAAEFHRDYHLPSIVGRHGEDGFVMSADEMGKMVRERGGEFISVWQGEQRVGAILNEPVGEQYALRRIGWLHGDPAWPKVGVIAALYWHSTRRARELGFRRLQLGGTPPYVEDGVFQFKTKWMGAIDVHETVWGHYFLLLDPSNAAMRRLLGERSFLVFNNAGEIVVLSGKQPSDVTMSPATARSITRWYCLRASPDADGVQANNDLPTSLRPWFVAVPHVKAS